MAAFHLVLYREPKKSPLAMGAARGQLAIRPREEAMSHTLTHHDKRYNTQNR
jgi:hypothetical protein